MPQFMAGRPEAAEVIWDWRGRGSIRAPQHTRSRARTRGLIQSAVATVVGVLLFLFLSHKLAHVAFGMSGLILFAALVSPLGLLAGIDRFFRASGRVVGQALTWVLMVPLFYLVFFPFGVLFRRGKRDRLKRYFETEATTYWEALRGPTAASRSLERQY